MKRFLLLFYYMAFVGGNGVQYTLHDGNNQFTAKMLSEVVKLNRGKSVVLSAFSLITPLSQLAAASEGDSHDELVNAIGFPDDSTTDDIFALIETKFNTVQGVQLKKASKLYIPLNYEVQESFATLSKNVYNSEIANVDFNDNLNAANEINTWVENQTNHRIKNLIDPGLITRDTRGVLVNALYFKGSWKNRFNVDATKSKQFYVNKENTLEIQMMHITRGYKHKDSHTLNSKILELPYEGDQSSFVIVLPNDQDGIEQLLEKLKDSKVLDKETKNLFYSEVEAVIPKFKIETTTDLKQVLKNMNVQKIFDVKQANLTKLLKTDEKLYISDAVQKAFIEINEEGAEAAAANAFFIAPASSFVSGPIYRFIADHPFAYFLKIHNEIMFNGVFYGS